MVGKFVSAISRAPSKLTVALSDAVVAWRIRSRYRSSQLIMTTGTPPTLTNVVRSMSSPDPGNSRATGRSSRSQCRATLRRPKLVSALTSAGDGGGQRSRSVAWYSPPAQYSSAVPPTTIGVFSMSTVIAAARRRRCRSCVFCAAIRASSPLARRRLCFPSSVTR